MSRQSNQPAKSFTHRTMVVSGASGRRAGDRGRRGQAGRERRAAGQDSRTAPEAARHRAHRRHRPVPLRGGGNPMIDIFVDTP